jgi:hypothetical protein
MAVTYPLLLHRLSSVSLFCVPSGKIFDKFGRARQTPRPMGGTTEWVDMQAP